MTPHNLVSTTFKLNLRSFNKRMKDHLLLDLNEKSAKPLQLDSNVNLICNNTNCNICINKNCNLNTKVVSVRQKLFMNGTPKTTGSNFEVLVKLV